MGFGIRWVFVVLAAWSFSVNALEITGEWQPGGLLLGKVEPGVAVRLAGKPLKLTDTGEFLIGLGRDEKGPIALQIIQPNGDATMEVFKVAPRSYNIQRVNGVPQNTVTPPASVTERIRRENEIVRAAKATVSDRLDFLAGFAMPLKGPITGVYGSQRVYNGTPKNPHYGLDVAAPTGTKVAAPAAGVVVLAEPDLYFSGGTVIIEHGHGLMSTLMHLSSVDVAVGQRVELGDIVGGVGATGRATGPHLDWRMNWLDQRVDPALVLKTLPFVEYSQQ